jgi:hypothetical protein
LTPSELADREGVHRTAMSRRLGKLYRSARSYGSRTRTVTLDDGVEFFEWSL